MTSVALCCLGIWSPEILQELLHQWVVTREGMVGLTEQMGHFQLSPRALALWLVTLLNPRVFLSHAE